MPTLYWSMSAWVVAAATAVDDASYVAAALRRALGTSTRSIFPPPILVILVSSPLLTETYSAIFAESASASLTTSALMDRPRIMLFFPPIAPVLSALSIPAMLTATVLLV